MKFPVLGRIALVAGLAVLAPGAPANAAEADYIGLFSGSWSGSGMVIKDGITVRVNCRATGNSSSNRLIIEGDCSVFILSVRIAADIVYDPMSGRYSGTYVGAKVGPALVSGQRNGDVVNLVVTWPKAVHGDTLAHMMISNSGGGTLQIVVSDIVTSGGVEQPTSDVSLTR